MLVFTGYTTTRDGWSLAVDWAIDIGSDVSVLWYNAANGKVESLSVVWSDLGYATMRSWGGLVR